MNEERECSSVLHVTKINQDEEMNSVDHFHKVRYKSYINKKQIMLLEYRIDDPFIDNRIPHLLLDLVLNGEGEGQIGEGKK